MSITENENQQPTKYAVALRLLKNAVDCINDKLNHLNEFDRVVTKDENSNVKIEELIHILECWEIMAYSRIKEQISFNEAERFRSVENIKEINDLNSLRSAIKKYRVFLADIGQRVASDPGLTIDSTVIKEVDNERLVREGKSPSNSEVTLTLNKAIILNPNGDLMINQERIVNVEPTSPDYYFLYTLHANFNQPIEHEQIYSFCVKKLAEVNNTANYEYQSTPQDFCSQRKSRIKAKIKEDDKKKLFEKIIISTKTTEGKPAYMMTNP